MSAALQQEKLVNMQALSEITGLPESTIQHSRMKHGLPAHRIGRHYYYYPSEVQLWIKQRKVAHK